MLNLWKKRKSKPVRTTTLINEAASVGAWTGNAYANATYRGAIDAVSRNIGKLKGTASPYANSRLNYMLQVRPNRYMSAYDWLYKMATHLWLNGNAWAFIDFDQSGRVQGIYPITASSVQMLTDDSGELYAEFTLRNGQTAIFRYSELIHLRRFFNSNELLGEGSGALDTVLELSETENATIIAGIKSGASIRGILKYTGMLQDDDLREIKNRFVEDYLSIENSGGVAALDSKAEYIPLNNQPVILDAEQSNAIRRKILDYVGISEKIVNSAYTEDEYSAFYESTVEPFAVALSLECTAKIFTEREIAFGNQIIFEANRLQFVSNATKVSLIKELMPLGVLTINQALEILNLPPVTDGDTRLQSLNYINANEALNYQLLRVKGGVKNAE
ncbi:MAG: phage portal protein [Synergistaceae bacterium]|nr:phage portal protein [Synergistaceae bacterium]